MIIWPLSLSGLYDDYTIYQSGWEYLEEGNTNFTYLYVDREKKTGIDE